MGIVYLVRREMRDGGLERTRFPISFFLWLPHNYFSVELQLNHLNELKSID